MSQAHSVVELKSQDASMRAPVLMPTLVDAPFDYLVPEGTEPGTLVEATLAGRRLVGVVWTGGSDEAVPLTKLKPITSVIKNTLPLSKSFLKWMDAVSEYTLAPKGMVLSLCGLTHAIRQTRKAFIPQVFDITLPTLTDAQRAVKEKIEVFCFGDDSTLNDNISGKTKPLLLDGVTGSGKTEVYFHTIAQVLAHQGKNDAICGVKPQVLVLLPEISLTHQWLERFEKTFGTTPVIWHSRMSPAAKARAWQAIARGEAQVVVGARSALFLPFNNLNIIIVDEEHDPSYKQEDGVLYHARDMAVLRAYYESVPILLVSATPSLETLENVREGRYHALHLASRYGSAGLPSVELVDLRIAPPERGDFLSPLVKFAALETLARNEQVLFFLNRRGYAPLLLCRACGHRFQCADCSAWLVVHGNKFTEGDLVPHASLPPAASGSPWKATHARSKATLSCHHCGHKEPMPKVCPSCKADAEKLAPCGPGVERIAEEVRAMFVGDGGEASVPSPSGGRSGWGLGTANPLQENSETRKGHPLEKTLQHVRELRKQMTQAEKRLWQKLRGETLNAKFRKQHPIGNYIVDFASFAPKLIIELDGGQHNTLEAAAHDRARTEFLTAQGFRVLRFWNNEVMKNLEGVVATIAEAVHQASPQPDLPPEGEGTLAALSVPLTSAEYAAPRMALLSSDESITPETWGQIEAGEIDILVGTQMVAKGHHFPRLTLVVVVDADVGLDGADLRAGERTYQLLHQLGGRAGRGELAGRVLVQTYNPDHPVMKALIAHDRDRLMALEAKERKAGGWPPFGQLAAILLDGVDEATVRAAGQMLARTAPEDARLKVLGPAPAQLSKLRGQYRYRLLVKAAPGIHLQRTLRAWLVSQKFKGVRVKVDVNPYYFL